MDFVIFSIMAAAFSLLLIWNWYSPPLPETVSSIEFDWQVQLPVFQKKDLESLLILLRKKKAVYLEVIAPDGKSFHIPIYWVKNKRWEDESSLGTYHHPVKKFTHRIKIRERKSRLAEVRTLCHELAHAVDYTWKISLCKDRSHKLPWVERGQEAFAELSVQASLGYEPRTEHVITARMYCWHCCPECAALSDDFCSSCFNAYMD